MPPLSAPPAAAEAGARGQNGGTPGPVRSSPQHPSAPGGSSPQHLPAPGRSPRPLPREEFLSHRGCGAPSLEFRKKMSRFRITYRWKSLTEPPGRSSSRPRATPSPAGVSPQHRPTPGGGSSQHTRSPEGAHLSTARAPTVFPPLPHNPCPGKNSEIGFSHRIAAPLLPAGTSARCLPLLWPLPAGSGPSVHPVTMGDRTSPGRHLSPSPPHGARRPPKAMVDPRSPAPRRSRTFPRRRRHPPAPRRSRTLPTKAVADSCPLGRPEATADPPQTALTPALPEATADPPQTAPTSARPLRRVLLPFPSGARAPPHRGASPLTEAGARPSATVGAHCACPCPASRPREGARVPRLPQPRARPRGAPSSGGAERPQRSKCPGKGEGPPSSRGLDAIATTGLWANTSQGRKSQLAPARRSRAVSQDPSRERLRFLK